MTLEDAKRSISIAKRAQQAGNLSDAFDNYQIGLGGYLELYKGEADARKKKDLGELIEAYMGEAEFLKEQMASAKAAPAPSVKSSISSYLFGTKSTPAPTPPPVPPRSSTSDSHDYTAEARRKRSAAKAAKPALDFKESISNISSGIGQKLSNLKGGAAVTGSKTSAVTGSKTEEVVKKTPELSEYEKQIMAEMLDATPGVGWDDIAGLAYAKQTLQEAVILPNLRPDLFTGLRSPPKGVLLFGPPGTGKTLLAKAVATESGFAFFSITAASVTSKYLGEGEKLMKAVFNLARILQPSVIFFDEIDALMSARKESEHEASRRLKTEFMTQIDGATTSNDDRLLIMGATNIPWELDEAVLRRLVKRIYVPLPDVAGRNRLITHLMKKQGSGGVNIISKPERLAKVVQLTEGYSGSDLTAVCQEAAMGPIRELGPAALLKVRPEDVRALTEVDFLVAVQNIRPSVSPDSLHKYADWAEQFGVSR